MFYNVVLVPAAKKKNLDENTRKIFEQFNKYLENNNQNKITYNKFYETISIYFSRVTNINPIEETELSKLLILWIKDIYRITSNKEMQNVFDKLIYSWLLYSYFYSVKRSKKKLSGNIIVFDTNLIVYLFGINGKERQFFVEYLVEKLKQNNCTIQINDFTLKEFRGLLSSTENMEVVAFKRNNPEIYQQLILNTEEYLIANIKEKYNIEVFINSKKILPNNETFLDLVSNLKIFKGFPTTQ